MSKKVGNQMTNIPQSYINMMDDLMKENSDLKLKILELSGFQKEKLTKEDYEVRRLELLKRQEEVKIVRYDIEQQLNKAKAKKKAGEIVNNDWYARTKYAYRMKGVELMSIQNSLGELKVAYKESNIKADNERMNHEYSKFKKFLQEKYSVEEYASLMLEYNKTMEE